MTVHQKQELVTVAATADLSGAASRFKVVTIGGTICSAALVKQAAGILWHGGEVGQGLSVVRTGITKAISGVAISTVGYPVTVADSGFLALTVSGGTMIGRARETCSSGDLVPVEVNFSNIIYQAAAV
jgi:hypothetical protein